MAFRGMNPEIEKMMENERVRAEEAERDKTEKVTSGTLVF